MKSEYYIVRVITNEHLERVNRDDGVPRFSSDGEPFYISDYDAALAISKLIEMLDGASYEVRTR